MGIACSIEKEKGGHCTGWDGIIPVEIHIPKNTNGWKAFRLVTDSIPCQTCSEDGADGIDAFHDVVNITIGETTKAHNPKNLLKFQKRVNDAVNACTNCHIKEPE